MPVRLVIAALLAACLLTACAAVPATLRSTGSVGWTERIPAAAEAFGEPLHSAANSHAALDDEAEDEGHGLLVGALLYIPNRILDVFDIVRARVRLGPGYAVGARATELADVFVGFYASIYIGLPGPRGRVMPRLPFGFESKSGVELSAADVTLEAGLGPDYGNFEFGFGTQLLIVGFDVGIEPYEILDLITGLITIDPADDDF